MFTGLIEDVGVICQIKDLPLGKLICVQTGLNTNDIKIGDSISVNGACQTVTQKSGALLTFEAMNQTLLKTNFNFFKKGDKVNLERAMSADSRFGGHMVSGHVDCVAKLVRIKEEGIAKIFTFEAETDLIIDKGSVALNGASLTVSEVSDYTFDVSLLPYTLNNTNFKFLSVNSFLNLEYDLIGKYIKKFTSKKESKITKEFLIENGF